MRSRRRPLTPAPPLWHHPGREDRNSSESPPDTERRMAENLRPAALPTLADWLGTLWNRLLFPGDRPPPAEAGRWGALLSLLILPAALLYPSLGFRLLEPDEGRYAQIPREMLERGSWIVPTLQGEPYLDKPPLFYWLVMA